MSEIKKPITILRQEFIDNLIKLCNDSGLPFFVIEDILKELVQEVHTASNEQYKKAKEEYEQVLKQEGK